MASQGKLWMLFYAVCSLKTDISAISGDASIFSSIFGYTSRHRSRWLFECTIICISPCCFIYEGWCGVSIWFPGFISLLWFSFLVFLCFVLMRLLWLRNSKERQNPTALKSITGSYVVIVEDTKGFLLEMRLSLKHWLVTMISKLRIITDRSPVKGNSSFNNPFSYLS